MTKASGARSYADIIADLFAVSKKMYEERHDPDYLINGVERRGVLMNEYDQLAARDRQGREAFESDPAARATVGKIIELDKVIAKSLGEYRAAAHKDVAAANAKVAAQQRVMEYLGGPVSGLKMDLKN